MIHVFDSCEVFVQNNKILVLLERNTLRCMSTIESIDSIFLWHQLAQNVDNKAENLIKDKNVYCHITYLRLIFI